MIAFPSLAGGLVTGITVLTQVSIIPQPMLDTYMVAAGEVMLCGTSVTTLSGNIGTEGWRPMLQVGGVQDAIRVAPPPPVVANATPVLSTLTDAVCEELQVNGTP